MEVEAPEVQVHGAGDGVAAVHQVDLGVDKARRILIDPDACLGEHFVVGPGDGMDIPLVWDMGRDDPHVQAGLGGGEQGGGDLVVQDQIGGHNIDGPDGPLEQGQQRTLADVLVVQRRIAEGLDEALAAGQAVGIGGPEGGDILQGPGVGVPHGEEHHGHGPDGLAPEKDAAVLPVAEPLMAVDVLVGQIDAAGEAHLSVNNHQLPVVPVVEPSGEHRHEGVEDLGPNAHLPEPLVVARGQGGNAAEVVIEHPDIDAPGGLPPQNIENSLPHDPLADDKELQEDILLGLAELLQHPGIDQVAQGKIFRLGVVIDRVAGHIIEIRGHCRGRVAEIGEIVRNQPFLPEIFPDHILGLVHAPAGPGAEPPSAEGQIEADARHREGQNQDNPGDFIGGIGAVVEQVYDGQHGQGRHKHLNPPPVLGKPDHRAQQRPQLQ